MIVVDFKLHSLLMIFENSENTMINLLLNIAGILAILYFLILPSLKTGVIPIQKLAITPIIFLYLNYDSVQRHFHPHGTEYGILFIALILGILIGAFFRSKTPIKADHEKSLIEITGSYFGLSVFILIFAAHFIIGFFESTHPGYLLQSNMISSILLFLLTGSSCIPTGGNLMLFYRFKKAIPETLVESS